MATGRLPDPNTAPVTAKGDLYTYSTVPAKLAVGNNGETLVADSSATTGLRWQGNYAAGKNKFINGDFNINQRNVSSTTSNDAFIFDRWSMIGVGGTTTTSSQTFTPGTAPVSGYEGNTFIRQAITGQTLQTEYAGIRQKIEDVRTFAGQTVTVSFWAKASSGTPYLWVEEQQFFGTGGSPSTTTTVQMGSTIQLNTSWTRYSVTKTVGSLSGKTIGTTANTSALQIVFWTSLGSSIRAYANATFQNATIDLWGVQIEAGSVATPFSTATGTLAGELAAASRYYQRFTASANYSPIFPSGYVDTSTSVVNQAFFPVRMRTKPSSVEYANARIVDAAGSTYNISAIALTANVTEHIAEIQSTITGGTGGRYCYIQANNNAGAYVGFSAEL